MRHYASPRFWALYDALPKDVRDPADKSYVLLKTDSRHPSLQFKKLGKYWSVRVGVHYRAIGLSVDGGMYWIWIGSHAEYDKMT